MSLSLFGMWISGVLSLLRRDNGRNIEDIGEIFQRNRGHGMDDWHTRAGIFERRFNQVTKGSSSWQKFNRSHRGLIYFFAIISFCSSLVSN